MKADFWHEKWELGHLGFHEDKVNPLLINHLHNLKLTKGDRIFLPLCGKTLDFGYLLNLGYQTVGIELSEIAAKDLFKELGVRPTISNKDNFKLYQAENVDVYVGDFFDFTAETLGKADAIYDRAAFIALPDAMRQAYSKHLTGMTQSVQQLLITLEYDQTVISGPPFSITADEIKKHYDSIYSIRMLECNNIEGGLKGKVACKESAWILKPIA